MEDFTEKEIKGLILYFCFNSKLKKDIYKSNDNLIKIESDCYLICKEWMNKYKKIYLYRELIKKIINIIKKENYDISDKDIDKKVYEKLFDGEYNDYLKQIKDTNYPDYLEDVNNANYELSIQNFNKKEFINHQFNFGIFNFEIYNIIKKRKKNELKLIKRKYLIKKGKLFIQFENSFYLLIGAYNYDLKKILTQNVLSFETKEKMINKYNYFKETDFDFNLKEDNISNVNILIKESKLNQNNLDKIKNEESKQNLSQSKNNNQINENKYDFDINKIYCFKFLIGIYFYFDEVGEKINEYFNIDSKSEKGFIVNIDLITSYKKYFNYNKIEKECKNNEKILTLIKRHKTLNQYKDNNEFLDEIFKILKSKYINELNKINDDSFYKIHNINNYKPNYKIKNNHSFYYFENGVIINEELFNILYSYNKLIKINENVFQINYCYGYKKIIISFDSYINIGFLANNKIFIPEMIIQSNDSLTNIINDIKYKGYEQFINTLKQKIWFK